MPAFMFRNRLEKVIDALIKSTEITETTLKWAESRRDALKALTSICNTFNSPEHAGKLLSKVIITCCLTVFILDWLSTHAPKIFSCFFVGLTEYTQDNRGDIGAWVREAALVGLQTLVLSLSTLGSVALNQDTVSRVVAGSIQQAVEKIDRTRALAGKVFSSIIHK